MDKTICMPERLGAIAFTVHTALIEGAWLLSNAGSESARLDAELLLRHVLEIGQEALYLEYDRPLGAHEQELFQDALVRRARHEPIAYITGQKEFWSLGFFVTRDVLIPRPETELLVEFVIAVSTSVNDKSPLKILDLGTGSGILAVCLAKERSDAEIWATDISAPALALARTNSARHGLAGEIHFLCGDLFAPVAEKKGFFHLIVSNPPYIRSGELQMLPPEIKEWEPRSALDGGVDGLDYYHRIIAQAGRYLAVGGYLALEIAADSGGEISRLFAAADCFDTPSLYQDYAGRDRVIGARKTTAFHV